MIFVIELVILCLLFTLVVVPITLKNPLSMVHNYPTEIYEKVLELGLTDGVENRKSKAFLIKRILAIIVLGILFGLIVYFFNGANTFGKGAGYAYLLWIGINWYDCIVLDWLWFCHSKKVMIPGTEGMKGYKDYWFHAKGALWGMLLGIPSALIAGIIVSILS